MGGVTQKMTVMARESENVHAIAVLRDPANGQVYGQVNFVQNNDGSVTVSGEVQNIVENTKHGFHIHEFGDTTNGCTSAGRSLNE